MARFEIPQEFGNELQYRRCKDTRSENEILASLRAFQPVTNEKNVWSFWDGGLDAMPSWTRRNVLDWVRILGDTWTVRVLDSVSESPNNALKYVYPDLLPSIYIKGKMDGAHKGPHAADMLRGACLYSHGGVYMDVSIILFRHLDRICWAQLSDPTSPYKVAVPWMYGVAIANHFVAARKGDVFIKRWHDLFVHLWRDRSNSDGLSTEPLLTALSTPEDMAQAKEARMSKYRWDFKVPPQQISEYISQILCWKRICMLEADPADGFDGAEYWQRHVLVWDALKEDWGGENMLGFPGSGQKMFNLLAVRLSADKESAEYRQAYALTWRLLKESCMQKITHVGGLTTSAHLGALWDRHEGKDAEVGTFAELLRYGSVNFEQTREIIAYVQAPQPVVTLKKGLLEI